ncbi:MAG: hypothetical protein AAGB48_03265 [Planctomycetota bacterium]
MDSPACPRCGYDQSGLLATYRQACPIEATCSECGCHFAWRDVHIAAEAPSWLVERRTPGWYRRAPGTALRALNPFAFLRSVRMEHTVSVPRLIGWLAVLYLLTGAGRAAVRFVQLVALQPNSKLLGSDAMLDFALHATLPFARVGFVEFQRFSSALFHIDIEYHADSVIHPYVTIALATAATSWLLFLIPWHALQSKKILKRHTLRLSIYGLPGLMLITVVCMGLDPDRQLERWANASLFARHTPAWDRFWDWRVLAQDLAFKRWLCFAGVAAWQTLWWWLAAKRYLRLERPAVFTLTLVGVSLLSTVALTYFLAAVDHEWARWVLVDPFF